MEFQTQSVADFFQQAALVDHELKSPLIMVTMKRSMNQPPSPDERERLKQQIAATRKKIAELQHMAETNAAQCAAEHTAVVDKAARAMDQRERVYREMQAASEKQKGFQAELARCEAARKAMEEQNAQLQNELNALNGKIRDLEKKRQKARKFCWVPFYGLGLAIDQLANDNNRVNAINERMRNYNTERGKFEAELHNLLKNKNNTTREIASLQTSYRTLSNQEKELREKITQLKALQLQWDSLAMYYRDLYNRLEMQDATTFAEILKELKEKNEAMRQIGLAS